MIRLLIVTASIVFLAILVDIALLYYQATIGKLFWKVKIFPDIGGLL